MATMPAPGMAARCVRDGCRHNGCCGRRLGPVTSKEEFLLGELTINYAERRVSVAGRTVAPTATGYALLFALSTNAGPVMTHDQLLRRVRGEGHSGDAGLVRTAVKRLRHKLGEGAHNPVRPVASC